MSTRLFRHYHYKLELGVQHQEAVQQPLKVSIKCFLLEQFLDKIILLYQIS